MAEVVYRIQCFNCGHKADLQQKVSYCPACRSNFMGHLIVAKCECGTEVKLTQKDNVCPKCSHKFVLIDHFKGE